MCKYISCSLIYCITIVKIFCAKTKKITKLSKAYKATEGVIPKQLEDFITIARKLKWIRKENNLQTKDTIVEQNQNSTSQMSYGQRTNNFDLLISLL